MENTGKEQYFYKIKNKKIHYKKMGRYYYILLFILRQKYRNLTLIFFKIFEKQSFLDRKKRRKGG